MKAGPERAIGDHVRNQKGDSQSGFFDEAMGGDSRWFHEHSLGMGCEALFPFSSISIFTFLPAAFIFIESSCILRICMYLANGRDRIKVRNSLPIRIVSYQP